MVKEASFQMLYYWKKINTVIKPKEHIKHRVQRIYADHLFFAHLLLIRKGLDLLKKIEKKQLYVYKTAISLTGSLLIPCLYLTRHV